MSYTKTVWADNSLPAVSATNLNKIEQGVFDAHNPTYSTLSSDTAPIISLPSTVVSGKLDVMVKGNTVNNILGSKGDCEVTADWTAFQCTKALDSTNKMFGANSLKMIVSSGGGCNVSINVFSSLTPLKYYLATLYLRNNDLTSGVKAYMYTNGSGAIVKSSSNVTATTFTKVLVKIQPSDWGTGSTNLLFEVDGTGSVGQWGNIDGVCINEISSADYALTNTELMAKYNYIDLTKSTSPMRIKSIGKNLFDKNEFWDYLNMYKDSFDPIQGIESDGSEYWEFSNAAYNNDPFMLGKFKEATQYTIKATFKVVTGTTLHIYMQYTDGTKLSISTSVTTYTTKTLTSDVGKTIDYIFISYGTAGSSRIKKSDFQLELGSTATTYEPYKSTESYCPVELKKVGIVSDTFDCNTGKCTKNIEKYILTANDIASISPQTGFVLALTNILSNQKGTLGNSAAPLNIVSVENKIETYASIASVATIGTYYISTSTGKILFILADGTDLATAKTALTGILVHYQLAMPVTTNYLPKLLVAEPNGAIIQEPVIADYNWYNSGITIDNSAYPITSFDYINKVDVQTGVFSPVDLNTVTIVGGGLSFTLSGAVTGDLYEFAYNYSPVLGTLATIAYTYETNLNAQMISCVETEKNLNLAVIELDKRLKTTDINTNILNPAAHKVLGRDSTNIKVEYKDSIQSLITAPGDLIIGTGANTPSKLAKGTDGQMLKLVSGLPAWVTPVQFASGSGTVSIPSTPATTNVNVDIPVGFTPTVIYFEITLNDGNKVIGKCKSGWRSTLKTTSTGFSTSIVLVATSFRFDDCTISTTNLRVALYNTSGGTLSSSMSVYWEAFA